jgi:Ricin-type beta-trefoil lectin domain/Putative Ig domain
MLKRIFAMAAAASLSLAGPAAIAQARAHPRPAAHLPALRVIDLHRAYEAQLGQVRLGKIAVIGSPRRARRGPAANAVAGCTEPNCPLVYNGGPVQHAPRVYLLLWGPNWTTDPGQEASASYLENFYAGLGVEPTDAWSATASLYPDRGNGFPAFTGSVFAGFADDTTTPPAGATPAQIAAEADAFAQHLTDPADAQIVVATQSGTCPQGFAAPCNGTSGTYCAWHSTSNEPFINLPYLLDAGSTCGQDFVNPSPGGDNDGWSIVGGDEYAAVATDPVPGTGWADTADSVSGGEIGDKCAWGGKAWGGSDPIGNVTLSTGTFAMQSLWSNAGGGCTMTGPAKDTVTVTSPQGQSSVLGEPVSLQLQASSSGAYLINWQAVGLPAGLALDSSTGLITGTPGTAGTYGVTVTAIDQTDKRRGVSFTWTVSPPPGNPVTGDHGKCLDDAGASTVSGTKVDIWTCNGTGAQKWTFAGGALSVLGKCLDDVTQGGAGSKLVIWTCNGHKAQTWTHLSNGEYVLKLNGLCLTDPSGSSVNGTQVVIRACRAFADQKWAGP